MLTRRIALVVMTLVLPVPLVACSSDGDRAACYSPTQGHPSPYDSQRTAVGCPCDEARDQPICVREKGPEYGLFCYNGRWQSVVDGPCQPPSPLPDAGADASGP
jgi:hypothetical protein